MMNPWKLAIRRFRSNASYQWRALRTVIDWTVGLYIVIPAFLLGLKFYLEWVQNPVLPAILSSVNNLWVYPFLLPLFFARLRTWAEPGDILFLRQRPAWVRGFVGFGLMELSIRQLLSFGMITILLLPLLFKGFGFSQSMVALLLIWGYTLSLLHALIRNRILVQFAGIRRVLVGWLWNLLLIVMFRFMTAYIIQHPFLFGCALVGVLLFIMLFAYWRVRVMYTFERDVDLELEIKMKLTGILLRQAVDTKQRKRKGSQPLLFRRSGYLYKVKGPGQQIGAIGVKTLWRSSSHMIFYWQLTGVGLIAIVLCSGALAALGLIVFPVLCVILGVWLNMYWRELVDSDVWNMFSFDGTQLSIASLHFATVNAVLPGLLWGLAFGFMTQSVGMGLLYGAIGVFAAMFIARVVMTLIGYKRKEHKEVEETSETISS